MRTLTAIALLLSGCAAQLRIPGIGTVDRAQICDDPCCGAQGVDCLVSADIQQTLPVFPVNEQGQARVDYFLGHPLNTAAPTDINQACGTLKETEFFRTKDWEISVAERAEFKAQFTTALSARLQLELGVVDDPSLSAEIEAAVRDLALTQAKFRAAVYTLDKNSVDLVRCRCGLADGPREDNPKANFRFVVSMTIVEASQIAKSTLVSALQARLGASAAVVRVHGLGSSEGDERLLSAA